MGRGRQKAKHTKVARELKYFSPDTDLSALQSELRGSDESSIDLDKWADFAAAPKSTDDIDAVDEDDEAQSA
jgi:hypothetical protein